MSNNYRKKYREIVNDLIRKSFPKIKGKLIFISELKIGNFIYSAIINYFLCFSWLIVHPKVRKYSKYAVEALLAHELAHIDLIVNMNLSEKISLAFKWLFTKKGKENFERDADILTIKKGYGKGLINFREESTKTYTKKQLRKKRKGYLAISEIKNLMKK